MAPELPAEVGDKPATLKPSIPFNTHQALTIAYIVIYALLFLFVYVQLWMILYYRHKRRSYQTVFLFLCLIWAGLRVTLFSFYFNRDSIESVNEMTMFWYWLLYSFPVVLQFTVLVILVSFFSQVVIRARYPEHTDKYRRIVRVICGLSVILFVVVNVVCGCISRIYKDPCTISYNALVIRISINDTLFLLFGFALSYWIFALNRIANARTLLERRGTTMIRAWLTCGFICFLFLTRAMYNFAALIVSHTRQAQMKTTWLSVTDQADLVDLYDGYNFIVYGVVLFCWEILPTFIVTVFFRVQRPTNLNSVSLDEISREQHYNTFDNPPHLIRTESSNSRSYNSNNPSRDRHQAFRQSYKKDSRRNLWRNSPSRSPQQYTGT